MSDKPSVGEVRRKQVFKQRINLYNYSGGQQALFCKLEMHIPDNLTIYILGTCCKATLLAHIRCFYFATLFIIAWVFVLLLSVSKHVL